MSPQRISLNIKIFELGSQRAEALPSLKPPELIAEVLQEFQGELPFLGTRPESYALRLTDGTRLDDQLPLSEQSLGNSPNLILDEREVNLPTGAAPLSKAAYLREPNSGQVYRLWWQPALIGRPHPGKSDDLLLAVNLDSLQEGRKASRRQALLTERKGQFYITNLSPKNPFIVMTEKDGQPKKYSIEEGEYPLRDKDQLSLGGDSIRLVFRLNVLETKS
ncbi:MAG: hypothetical protein WCS37_00680 [Chloroflexota bacterium]